MQIDIYSKNFSLVAEYKAPQGTMVPRVGEFIALPPEMSQRVQNLTHALVHDVLWLLQGTPEAGQLTAVVSCHATGHDASNRLFRLEENGWLQPRN